MSLIHTVALTFYKITFWYQSTTYTYVYLKLHLMFKFLSSLPAVHLDNLLIF